MERDLFKFNKIQKEYDFAQNAEIGKILAEEAKAKKAAQNGLVGQHIVERASQIKDEKMKSVIANKNAFNEKYKFERLASETAYQMMVNDFARIVCKNLRATEGFFATTRENPVVKTEDFKFLVDAHRYMDKTTYLMLIDSVLSKCCNLITNQRRPKKELEDAKLSAVYSAINEIFSKEIDYVQVDYIQNHNQNRSHENDKNNINGILGGC